MARGGKREGAGRKKGSRSRTTEERERAMRELSERLGSAIPNAFKGDSHELLMAIYKDPSMPMLLRIDAAKAAISYEKPKLASVQHSGDESNPVHMRTVIEQRIIDADSRADHLNGGAAQVRPAAQARPI